MADKGLTPNLKLSQFTPDYKPGWSKDLNEDFSKIDTAITKVDGESMKASVYDPQGKRQDFFKALDELIPAGVTLPYAGATAPSGFLLCQGQAVSRATYARLFVAIGVTYGAGNGTTTFNVPDMRNKFPLGTGTNVLGKTGGAETHVLKLEEAPPHTHTIARQNSGASQQTSSLWAVQTANYTDTYVMGFGSDTQGGGQAHNNMPPFIALNYIIKI